MHQARLTKAKLTRSRWIQLGLTSVLALSASTMISQSSSAQAAATPQLPIRLNIGGSEFSDSKGNIWQADRGDCNGAVGRPTQRPIRSTKDDALFQTYRSDLNACDIELANGTWNMRLLFSEPNATRSNTRLFSIIANEQTIIRRLDLFQVGRGQDSAVVVSRKVKITDNELKIKFQSSRGGAILNGIELLPIRITPTTTPTTTTASTSIPASTTPTGTITAPATSTTTSPVSTISSSTTTTSGTTATPASPTTTTRPTTSVPPSVSTPTAPTTTVPTGTTAQLRGKVSWQWQLQGAIDTSVQADVFDVDLFDVPTATISSLNAQGKTTICYFSGGSYEDWRSDAGAFPASVLGAPLDGWPGERWLDIRQLDVLRPIMAARLDLCKAKGFHAAEPDNVDGFANNSGFPLTGADQIAYNKMLSQLAHERGLKIGLKNNLDQVATLEPFFDFAVNEQCLQYNECNMLKPFVNAGKTVLHVEYSGSFPAMCSNPTTAGFSTLKKTLALTATPRNAC